MAVPQSLIADRASHDASHVTYVDPPPSVARSLREGWAGRHLLGWLAGRVLVKLYTKTKLGRAWVLARPVVDGGARTLLFGGVLSIAAPNDVPYFLFLMVGMMAWMTFDETLQWGTRGLDRYLKLVRNFNFPLVVLPIAAGAQGLVFLATYLVIIAAALAWFALAEGQMYLQLGPELLVAVLGLALTLLFAWGLALWLSVIDARTYDVRNAMRYLLPVWLYVSPVMYPLTQLGDPWKTLAVLNPVAPMVEMVKYGLIGAADVSVLSIGYAVGVTAVAVLSGLWYFSRNAARAVEVVEDDARREADEELEE
jgi:lipopolysaccharide transport system permease protein